MLFSVKQLLAQLLSSFIQIKGTTNAQNLALRLYDANGAIVQHASLRASRSGKAELSQLRFSYGDISS